MKLNSKIIRLLIMFVLIGVYLLLNTQSTLLYAKKNPIIKDTSKVEITPNRENTPSQSQYVIVYYFHATARCSNCFKIENYSKEAVETGFVNELKNKKVIWNMLNIDLPENEHFIKDYNLYTKSLVIVSMKDGKQVQWKNLEKVWDHLRDKEAFMKYVQTEIKGFLGA